MAPSKNKKKPMEKLKKKINPFEVHINRDKQNVLGRKLKADRGLPGVSRSKALEKRKKTLLQEYLTKDKDNVLKDRRIGEKDLTMSFEEKAQARYAAELMKAHKKKNIYNLDNSEDLILTHRGNTLEEIEKFDNPRSDDEDDYDDNESGQLNKKFVSEAHFGGGMFSKTDGHRDVLAELILQSKKQKAEQQKTREDNIKKTDDLDSEWKDLQALVFKSSNMIPKTEERENSNYDVTLRKLIFEKCGEATDRLKTDEEIEKEKNDKLEKLELDRLARMKGFLNDADSKNKHRSADHLDDGFDIEDIEEEQEDNAILAYDDDGIMVGIKKKDNNNEENNDDDDDKKSQSDNEEVDDDNEEAEDEEEDEDEDEDDEDDDEDENNLSDFKESDSSSDEDEDEDENQTDDTVFKPLTQKSRDEDESEDKGEGENNKDNTVFKPLTQKSRVEDIDDKNKNENKEKPLVVTLCITTEEDKIKEAKKQAEEENKLPNTFDYHVRDIINTSNVKTTDDIINVFKKFDELCPPLYDLAQKNSQLTWTVIQNIMKEKHDKFELNKKKYPGLDTLILFKIISLLFPTSDFRHPVVTPCIIFMSQILYRCKVKSKLDIAKGLFISTLMLEFTVLSKRFSPEVINYLTGIIYISTNKKQTMNIRKKYSPFKNDDEFLNLLVLDESLKTYKIQPKEPHMKASDLINNNNIDNDFKIRSYLTAINILNEFKNQLNEIDAIYSIYEPIISLMKINNYKNYPKNIRQYIKNIINEFDELKNKKLNYLIKNKKKPKALRLYEPKIETIYDGKRHRPMSKEKAEHEKLVHKVKREMKGAIREVRRDSAFIAKVQIKEQIKGDIERKRRVKEIYSEGAMQQGELNQLKRMKSKKH